MRGFEQFRLVVGREVSESLRRTSVRLLIGVLLLVSIAGVVVPEVIGGSGRPDYDVHLDDALPAEIGERLEATAETEEVDVILVPSRELRSSPRIAVEDGTVDAAVLAGEPPVIITEDDRSDRLATLLTQAVSPTVLADRLDSLGVDPEDGASVLGQPSVAFDAVSTSDQTQRRGVGFAAAFVIYFAMLTVSVQVANGTAIEKASRVTEVLLAVVRPGALLFGKVVGVSLVSLAGVLALIAPVLAKALVGGSLPPNSLSTIGVALVWFVIGLAFWAPLAGMFGAMVERQEEVGTAMQPITLLLVGALAVATTSPDSPVGAVLGYLPVTSPVVEPMRIAIGSASAIEAVVSALLLAAAAVIAVRIGGVVHQRAVVRTGSRLRFRDLR